MYYDPCFDFDFTEGADEPILPEGVYELKVKEVEPMKTKDGTKDQVRFIFLHKSGLQVYHYCMNESDPKNGGRWRLKKLLGVLLGYKIPKGSIRVSLSELVGKKVKVKIKHEEWNGRTQAKIAEVIDDAPSPGQEEIWNEEEMAKDLPF